MNWRCPICKRLLVHRPSTETEEKFQTRCAAHAKEARICTAEMLAQKLKADGLVPLLTESGDAFVHAYLALSETGLVRRHFTRIRTHILPGRGSKRSRRRKGDDYVSSMPWGPAWAVQYDDFMHARKVSLARRAAAVKEAAESPETIERVVAFMALAGVDSTAGS